MIFRISIRKKIDRTYGLYGRTIKHSERERMIPDRKMKTMLRNRSNEVDIPRLFSDR